MGEKITTYAKNNNDKIKTKITTWNQPTGIKRWQTNTTQSCSSVYYGDLLTSNQIPFSCSVYIILYTPWI